jgi:hypothetical protein
MSPVTRLAKSKHAISYSMLASQSARGERRYFKTCASVAALRSSSLLVMKGAQVVQQNGEAPTRRHRADLCRDAKVNDAVGKHCGHALALSDSLAEHAARRDCPEIQIKQNTEKCHDSDKGLNCARGTAPFPTPSCSSLSHPYRSTAVGLNGSPDAVASGNAPGLPRPCTLGRGIGRCGHLARNSYGMIAGRAEPVSGLKGPPRTVGQATRQAATQVGEGSQIAGRI